MDDEPESKKDLSHQKVYVKPELKRISLDDEEALVEFCKDKPYTAEELKEAIKGMLPGKEKKQNRIALEMTAFHMDEAMRFCNQLDLSGLGPLEKREWETRMKACKDAIEFTKQSTQQLMKILA